MDQLETVSSKPKTKAIARLLSTLNGKLLIYQLFALVFFHLAG